MIRVKLGASLDGLHSSILSVLAAMAEDHEVWITSGTEFASGRVPASLHPVGRAVDVRWDPDVLTTLMAYLRGHESRGWASRFDVVPYPDSHIHIEWEIR